MKLEVEIDLYEITICNEQGYEVCHWVEDEWVEDSTVVASIATAIKLAYTDPEKLVKMNKKHIESQK